MGHADTVAECRRVKRGWWTAGPTTQAFWAECPTTTTKRCKRAGQRPPERRAGCPGADDSCDSGDTDWSRIIARYDNDYPSPGRVQSISSWLVTH